MKKCLGVLGLLLLVTPAQAYPIVYPSAISTSPGCTNLTVTYADSGFPEAPFPSGNWMMYQGMAGRGYMNITNGELKTASYSYSGGQGGNCPVWFLLPPDAEVGQGFYGFFANIQGVRDDRVPGCTQFMLRTAGNKEPKHMTAYIVCPGGKTIQMQLKHLAHFDTQPIEMRWQAQWHSDVLPPSWAPATTEQPTYALGTIRKFRNGSWFETPIVNIVP